MCAIINKVANQALRTFRYSNSNCYASNFDKLVKLTQTLNVTDVGLSPDGDDLSTLSDPFAPVCHVNIIECQYFTLGIFIVRKGCALPLHDHPGMTGIVKVLYGTLKITSYEAKNGALTVEEHSTVNKIPVTRRPDAVITSSSDCQVLTPHLGNFHCVQSVGGDAAIFDILAPPYAEISDCHYYRDISLSPENKMLDSQESDGSKEMHQSCLIRIPQPFDFYCDSLPYKGPSIAVECEDDGT